MRLTVLSGVLATLAACSFDRRGLGDSGNTADADPTAPDADPTAPDADPTAPDAAPGAPDAARPDAAPPDAVPIVDGDGDGVADDADNCIATRNPEQYDEDGDLVGDVCDNCPHVVNADQVSADGDLVGDACDPNNDNGDILTYFDGFNGTALDPSWAVAFGTNTWTVADGRLRQTGLQIEPKALVWTPVSDDFITIDTGVDVREIVPVTTGAPSQRRRVGLVTNRTASSSNGSFGRLAALSDDVSDTADAAAAVYSLTSATGASGFPDNTDGLGTPLETTFYALRSDVYVTANQWFIVDDEAGNGLAFVSDTNLSLPTGTAGPYTYGVSAYFRYVVIYTRAF